MKNKINVVLRQREIYCKNSLWNIKLNKKWAYSHSRNFSYLLDSANLQNVTRDNVCRRKQDIITTYDDIWNAANALLEHNIGLKGKYENFIQEHTERFSKLEKTTIKECKLVLFICFWIFEKWKRYQGINQIFFILYGEGS